MKNLLNLFAQWLLQATQPKEDFNESDSKLASSISNPRKIIKCPIYTTINRKHFLVLDKLAKDTGMSKDEVLELLIERLDYA